MTMNAKRRRAHDKLAALPGVRPVRRPLAPDSHEEFDLYYVRTGRKSAHPLVIIPGGPGAASVALYRGLRRHAAAKGVDVIMVDHRGVGMSRHDDRGADLPPEALTIEQAVNDVAAVLDDAQVDKAVIYGTSYGTYLAAGFGVRHPDRVHAMILDSPVLSAQDIDAARNATRRVLWDGEDPEAAESGTQGAKARRRRRAHPGGRTAHRGGVRFGRTRGADRVNSISCCAAGADCGPCSTGLAVSVRSQGAVSPRAGPGGPDRVPRTQLRCRARRQAARPGRRVSRVRQLSQWNSRPNPTTSSRRCRSSAGRPSSSPVAATSSRPRSVAQEIVSLIPDSVLVELATAGHSAIDLRERAALDIVAAVYDGDISSLPARAEGTRREAGRVGGAAAGGGDRRRGGRRIRAARRGSAGACSGSAS